MPAYDFKVSAKVSGNPAAKYCKKCGRLLETTSFWRNRSKGDGLNRECKFCAYERTKKYMEKYNKSPNGKAVFARAAAKYTRSPKGRKRDLRYKKSPKGRAARRRHYHRKKLLQFIADMM